MKISDILEMAAFNKTITKSDMPQYENENFLLWGASTVRDYANLGQARIRFNIMDIPLFYKFKKEGDETPADSATVGEIQFIMNTEGEIQGIINIEFNPTYRNSGRGSRLIQDIKDTVKKGFNVYLIQDAAQKFWDKMGVKYTDSLKMMGRIEK